jgi:kinesin family member C1
MKIVLKKPPPPSSAKLPSQELRGNIRVFARVRPFLPGDGASQEAESAIVVNHDGASLSVGKTGAESSAFSFDKAFAPSVGQEAVFLEVSEFVQSALDGFNVCLFSYGQTGSGSSIVSFVSVPFFFTDR